MEEINKCRICKKLVGWKRIEKTLSILNNEHPSCRARFNARLKQKIDEYFEKIEQAYDQLGDANPELK